MSRPHHQISPPSTTQNKQSALMMMRNAVVPSTW